MNRSYHFLLAILIVSCLQSCKKDKVDLVSPAEDDSWFLNSTNCIFSGRIGDSGVVWKYGLYEFQRGNSIGAVGSNELPQTSLGFWLTSNKDSSTRFEINTPGYNEDSNELFLKVLTIGEKEIGGLIQKFEMNLTLKNVVYTTIGDQTNSALKLLKTEKLKDVFGRDNVLAWFKVSCNFYSTVDSTSFSL